MFSLELSTYIVYERKVPGDKLFIEVELLKIKLGTARIRGVAKVNNEIVSKAEFKEVVVTDTIYIPQEKKFLNFQI